MASEAAALEVADHGAAAVVSEVVLVPGEEVAAVVSVEAVGESVVAASVEAAADGGRCVKQCLRPGTKSTFVKRLQN